MSQQDSISSLYKERTNLRTIITAVIIIVIGGAILTCTHEIEFIQKRHALATILTELSAFVIIAGIVAVFWELYARRAFMDEFNEVLERILRRTELAQEIQAAGITKFTTDFMQGIDWPGLFQHVRQIDIFVAYARTWLGSVTNQLEALRGQDVQIRVVLPDPTNVRIVSEMARRFQQTEEEVKSNIKNAHDTLIGKFGSDSKCKLSIFYVSKVPVFSFFRFDKTTVLSLYKHRDGRGNIPVFFAKEGGQLYGFLSDEFSALIGNTEQTKQVFPFRK